MFVLKSFVRTASDRVRTLCFFLDWFFAEATWNFFVSFFLEFRPWYQSFWFSRTSWSKENLLTYFTGRRMLFTILHSYDDRNCSASLFTARIKIRILKMFLLVMGRFHDKKDPKTFLLISEIWYHRCTSSWAISAQVGVQLGKLVEVAVGGNG